MEAKINYYSRLEELLVTHKMRQIDVTKITGIAGSTIRGWREGHIPNVEHVYKVAQLFNITVEEFLTGNKPEAVLLDAAEKTLLDYYKMYDERDKEELLEFAKLKAAHYSSTPVKNISIG